MDVNENRVRGVYRKRFTTDGHNIRLKIKRELLVFQCVYYIEEKKNFQFYFQIETTKTPPTIIQDVLVFKHFRIPLFVTI